MTHILEDSTHKIEGHPAKKRGQLGSRCICTYTYTADRKNLHHLRGSLPLIFTGFDTFQVVQDSAIEIIHTYSYHKYHPNLCKYPSDMDPMG